MATAPLTATARSGSMKGTRPARHRLDDSRIDVDADHLDAAGGEGRRGRQSDVAQSDDRDATVERSR